ncbi:MAG TPA: NEW3 domain-containing protein [Mobilitalea sp.]|nr:NEW3 domain-containing protein [Mobilitalea sp.]
MNQVKKLIYTLFFSISLLLCCMQTYSIVFANDQSSTITNYLMYPGETANARLSIENKDIKSHTYSLSFEQLTEGFHGYFSIEGKVIDSIQLSASQKSIINFSLEVPVNPSISDMSVPLDILRDDGTRDNITLNYTLNQDYSISITCNLQSIKAINGDTISLEIGVANTGNKDLSALSLQVELPYKWILERQDPSNLDIKSGETGLYKLALTIPPSQQACEYPIKISCSNTEVSSNSVTVPVTVSTSINLLWWIAGIIVLLSIFTLLYFKKHGRR